MLKKYIIAAILILVMVTGLLWMLWGNLTVGLTTISVEESNLPAAFDGYRIAHISDLHNSWLWPQVMEALRQAQPDIIVITGDMVDWKHTDVPMALSFAEQAVTVAPCYYVIGNHEGKMDQDLAAQLVSGLRELGVRVLEDEAVLLSRGEETISLVGHQWGTGADLAALTDFDGYKILLSHQPERLQEYAGASYDLVFSGHAHGGQARLPWIGGLFAPDQGWLPAITAGRYCQGSTDLIVSRGIGNSSFPIRFNNRPEVVLVVLESE